MVDPPVSCRLPPAQGVLASACASTVLPTVFTVTAAELVHPNPFFTVTVKLPAPRPVKEGSVWKFVPSMEYERPLPTGLLTLTVPLGWSQLVLSVAESTGAAGSSSTFTVAVAVAAQPFPSVAVTV